MGWLLWAIGAAEYLNVIDKGVVADANCRHVTLGLVLGCRRGPDGEEDLGALL